MAWCTNCGEKIHTDDVDANLILGEPYCDECYEELRDELENPDLGEDGAYNLGLED